MERTGVHVRPAGESEGVQTPAERVHFRHHAGDRHCLSGQGQDHQAELCPQAEAGDDAPRHQIPVHVREPGQHVPPGPVVVDRLVAVGQVRTPVAHHHAADDQEHVHVRVLDVRAATLGVRAAVPGPARVLRAEHRHPGTGDAVLQRPGPQPPRHAAGQQVRVLVTARRPGPGQHHTRQHGRGHVRDPAVHVGRSASGILRRVRRQVLQERDDHHAVRVQDQPVPAQQPARGHQRFAGPTPAHGHRRRSHIQPARDAGMPAGGDRQPDGPVHSVHVADRPQPGHVVPTVADGQLRATLSVQEVPADRHLRRGTQIGPQATGAVVGPRGGRYLILETTAGQRL